MNITPLRPERRDPVCIPELAELGLQTSDPNADWIIHVYMLGGLLAELAKLCAVKFPHAAIGGALVSEIRQEVDRLFGDGPEVPEELVCWPWEIEYRRRAERGGGHE
ncbi:hypothetical protein DYH09_13865 [bacterium CPR1]|nr:hypothetical protein [bacterium CPR1]